MSSVAKKLLQVQPSAGEAGAPVYVDDVFSTTLYTGNGSSQTVESDVALGKDNVTLFKYNDNSTTLATLTNHEEGDIVVIWDTNSTSGITFTVNSNSTTALHSQYTWTSYGYYQNLHKYTITASDVSAGNINVTASSGTTWGGNVFLIKGATGVSLEATTTENNGNTVSASSFTTSSYGILLISDRDPDATSPASTDSTLVGSVNSDPTYFSIHAWLMDSGASATVTGVQGSSNYFQTYAVIEVEGASNDGGLLWLKERTNARYHYLYDTERGGLKSLSSNANSGQANYDSSKVSALSGTGFSVGNGVEANGNTYDYATWTFKKKPGFFDIVTYTGNGTAGRTVSHNLGSVPGMIIVKRTDTNTNWPVYHRSLTAGHNVYLNLTAASANYSGIDFDNVTSTSFDVGNDTEINASGGTYVAYLFAHDAQDFGTNSDESIIKCGSYTGNGSTDGPEIDLGFEAQWVLIKNSGGSAGWIMSDIMRGMAVDGYDPYLRPNASDAEYTTYNWIHPTATGFKLTETGGSLNSNGQTYIYVAIRRPHKPASEFAATDLFSMDAAGSTTNPAFVSNGHVVDMAFEKTPSGIGAPLIFSRLTGQKYLDTTSTSAEGTGSSVFWDYMSGCLDGFGNASNYQGWMFRRAPGFFDVVAYTGQSAEMEISHNLGVTPELIIQKCRTQGSGYNWNSWYTGLTNSQYVNLNDSGQIASSSNLWGTNATVATDSIFRVGAATTGVNGGPSNDHIAYLFASAEGISKIGTFTRTSGDTTNVDCGFSNGARFVVFKRVSGGTGNWTVYDTVRGIVAGNDPYFFFNNTAASVTNTDYIDPYSAGFTVTSGIATGTFFFLAIA